MVKLTIEKVNALNIIRFSTKSKLLRTGFREMSEKKCYN